MSSPELTPPVAAPEGAMQESRALAAKRFVLATDLDGTFLGGDESARHHLYQWIEDNRGTVGLIFVSGRDLPFIEQLCDGTKVPWPDYVIGDVGTTIAHIENRVENGGGSRRAVPIAELESEIAARWNDAGPRILNALDGAPGLKPQATPFRYRMSYHYHPDDYDETAASRIAEMGYDVLISDNRYFDVLPKGVSKGPSLLRLIDWLGLDGDRVLVAGDTLNDLSLFQTGLKGVAVGNSEAALLQRLKREDHIHHANGHGAAGILEAIDAFKLHPVNGGTR